ncbi:hypothetical protein HY522_05720 [bacterium]|nr:hypothetical protein [bacterium]
MERYQPFNPLKFIQTLNASGIKYLLIGRRALVFHGAPVQTVDYDFFISYEKKNFRLFLDLCDRLDLEVIPFGTDDPSKSCKLSVYAGGEKMDIFRAKGYSLKSGGTVTFDEMWATRQVIRLEDGTELFVPSLECLEKTKRIRLTPKDVEDIKYIRELIARRDRL